MSNNSALRFSLHCEPEKGVFNLHDNLSGIKLLQNVRMLVVCRVQRKLHNYLSTSWQIISEQTDTRVNPLHGPLHIHQLTSDGDDDGLRFTITFALAENHPMFLWKLEVTNQGSEPVEVERIELLRVGGQNRGSCFRLGSSNQPAYSFFSNGWQSWSYCGTYLVDSAMRTTRLGRLQKPMVINPGTPSLRQPGYFSSDFFGVVCDRSSRTGMLLGFLSQQQHFGTIEAVLYDQPSLRMWANGDSARLDPGKCIETDWAVVFPFELDDPDPFNEYLQAVAREHGLKNDKTIPTGWCSWYHYFTNITPEVLRSNLKELQNLRCRLPLDGFQIDDGFEAQVGDWFAFKPAFRDGVEPLAVEIKAAGFQPGLWLAPFILHPHARTVSEHPEWLLQDAHRRPVNCGFGWNALTHGLDLTVPEALDYAQRVVSTAVHEWGYSYLKLDFLYAAAVTGRYRDPSCTRAQVLRSGIQALREAGGRDVFLVGCGAPLGSVLGLVDSMRISEDVSPDWYPHIYGIGLGIRNEPFMPSVRNAVHNTLTRSPLHQRWWINDPDCLLVRRDTNLTLPEVQTLASAIAFSGGSLLISDDMEMLDEERRRIIEVLLPLIGLRPQVIDLFERASPRCLRIDLRSPAGRWHLLARFNWEDKPASWQLDPQDFRLQSGSYLLRSFWDGMIGTVTPGGRLSMPPLTAHGVCVLALRPHHGDSTQYIGSNLHISQGLEVSSWRPAEDGLELELNLPRRATGTIYLSMPQLPRQVKVDQEPADWSEVLPGYIQINIEFNQLVNVYIQYSTAFSAQSR